MSTFEDIEFMYSGDYYEYGYDNEYWENDHTEEDDRNQDEIDAEFEQQYAELFQSIRKSDSTQGMSVSEVIERGKKFVSDHADQFCDDDDINDADHQDYMEYFFPGNEVFATESDMSYPSMARTKMEENLNKVHQAISDRIIQLELTPNQPEASYEQALNSFLNVKFRDKKDLRMRDKLRNVMNDPALASQLLFRYQYEFYPDIEPVRFKIKNVDVSKLDAEILEILNFDERKIQAKMKLVRNIKFMYTPSPEDYRGKDRKFFDFGQIIKQNSQSFKRFAEFAKKIKHKNLIYQWYKYYVWKTAPMLDNKIVVLNNPNQVPLPLRLKTNEIIVIPTTLKLRHRRFTRDYFQLMCCYNYVIKYVKPSQLNRVKKILGISDSDQRIIINQTISPTQAEQESVQTRPPSPDYRPTSPPMTEVTQEISVKRKAETAKVTASDRSKHKKSKKSEKVKE